MLMQKCSGQSAVETRSLFKTGYVDIKKPSRYWEATPKLNLLLLRWMAMFKNYQGVITGNAARSK
jgi:hypothetical protein